MPNTHRTLAELFADCADAVRSKTGSNEQIVADNLPTEIGSISVGNSNGITSGSIIPASSANSLVINIGNGKRGFLIRCTAALVSDAPKVFCIIGIKDEIGLVCGTTTTGTGLGYPTYKFGTSLATSGGTLFNNDGTVDVRGGTRNFIAEEYKWYAW